MPGQTVRLFNRKRFSPADFAASATSNWILLAKDVPVAEAMQALVSVRIHSIQTAIGTGSTLTFGVFNSAPTEEEPGVDFLSYNSSTGAIAPVISIELNATNCAAATTANDLWRRVFVSAASTGLGSFATVAYQVVTPASPAGVVFVSADLILKW